MAIASAAVHEVIAAIASAVGGHSQRSDDRRRLAWPGRGRSRHALAVCPRTDAQLW
ncbi:hypothetical protein OAO87_02910 [bacterium]|nr:hypothetical protein [bacterium]